MLKKAPGVSDRAGPKMDRDVPKTRPGAPWSVRPLFLQSFLEARAGTREGLQPASTVASLSAGGAEGGPILGPRLGKNRFSFEYEAYDLHALRPGGLGGLYNYLCLFLKVMFDDLSCSC